MTVTYGIVCETISLNGNTRTAFGIAAYAHTSQTSSSTIIASVSDITTDKESLVQLVDACNRGNLSLVHLPEIVDDFLADDCYDV